ncbi:PASTA domain-containing protein [Gordonia sp. LUNF6]
MTGVVAAVVAAGLLVGCSTGDVSAGGATSPETTEMNTQHPAAPVSSAANAIMPNVVCMNLQEAQNEIQRAGVFYSRSNDATGRGRHQIRDRNWVVVAQTPSPGTPIGEGDAVLSVVKIGEPSLC